MPKQAGFPTALQQPILLYSAPLLQPRGSAFPMSRGPLPEKEVFAQDSSFLRNAGLRMC